MTLTDQQRTWDQAADHCLNHVKRAMELSDVIKSIKHLTVISVIPIISSNHSTLLITPEHPESLDSVRFFTRQVGAVAGVTFWKAIKTGEYWMLRGITSNGVHLDVATTLLNSVPQELEL